MWWFRRFADKLRVVSSRFRHGFVVVACAICGPVISVSARNDILHNMIPTRVMRADFEFDQIESTTSAAHAFDAGTHDSQRPKCGPCSSRLNHDFYKSI